MLVWMLVASDDATSGSVIANAERISPASSGSSHCSFCSGVPNRCSVSMLPVSGAWQLIASGAMSGDQPVTSATAAYSRLDSPEIVGQEQVPQPLRPRLGLQLLDDGRQLPLRRRAPPRGPELRVGGLGREDPVVEEGAHALGVVVGHGAGCEVHASHSTTTGPPTGQTRNRGTRIPRGAAVQDRRRRAAAGRQRRHRAPVGRSGRAAGAARRVQPQGHRRRRAGRVRPRPRPDRPRPVRSAALGPQPARRPRARPWCRTR